MKKLAQQIKKLPDTPGVYFFKRKNEILYIGKATSLRDRVRSYFSDAAIEVNRGGRIVQMLSLATKVDYQVTDSVLEALILESQLIKKYQPKYNAKAKDDKSYLYVIITHEDFPRVMMVRGSQCQGSTLTEKGRTFKLQKFGPFPNASELKSALKIVRKILPFRDTCKLHQPRGCFNYQIGLCPGSCIGAINKINYQKIIQQIKLLFRGQKQSLIKELKQLMRQASREHNFEQAARRRDQISALKHIQDVSLIKNPTPMSIRRGEFDPVRDFAFNGVDMRIEAYDVAHLAGSEAVGVMVVAENGEFKKSDYRKFKVTNGADDLANLRELLARRLTHADWPLPNLVVIDGGANQWRAARAVLTATNHKIPIVAVVKDEHHRPREIIGNPKARLAHRELILRLNHEAHRFAVAFHRHRQRRNF